MLNNRSKFFTLNIKNINKLIDNLADDNKYSVNQKDLTALLYILKDLEYESHTITISAVQKKYIKDILGMSDSSYSHFITKMRKLEIFCNKIRNDVYELNDEYINFGKNKWEAGEYVKVSSNGLFNDLKNSNKTISSLEIMIFLHLLNSIQFSDGNFGSNTIVITKDTKEEVAKKFDVTSRTIDNFIKKMKEVNLLSKISNGLYKVNEKYITFGGEIDNTPLVVRETKFVKPEGSIPTSREWLFKKNDKKGDDINE